jgi:hypothetical protein
MMKRSFLIDLLGLLLSSHQSAGADEATLRRFKTEYPAASRKLQDFYSNLRMSGTESYEKDTKKWEFRGNGQSLRSDIHEQDGKSIVYVANAKLSFDLKKSSDSSRYAVTMMGSASPAEFAELERAIRRRTNPANAPFAVLADPIERWFSDKNFRFIDAHEVDGPDGKIIKVDWELLVPDGPKRVGTYDFVPDGSWALRACEFYFDHKDPASGQIWHLGQHIVVDYEGQKDGTPLVKRLRTWGSGPGGKSPETVWEVTELTPGPVAQAEFELSAFGLSSAPVAEPTPVAFYLLGLSAVAAVMVFVFRYLQRRAENSANPA